MRHTPVSLSLLNRFRARLMVFLLAGAMLAALLPAAALAQLSTIRDAEIEALLRDYARPIFSAAGLSPSSVDIVLVQNSAINAFVTDSSRVFIFTGLLDQAKTPGEVQGVIAHEAGHIAGGHLARSRQELRRASINNIIATLAGAAAIAGGSITGNAGISTAGAAILQGGQQVARRTYLRYARGQESSADQAAAKFLRQSGISAKGMLAMFSRLADQMLVSIRNIDPYALSHPLPRERIAVIERLARASPYFETEAKPDLKLRHALMQAKLMAFTGRPDRVFRRYKSDALPARYARAIALYRSADLRRAIREIDALITDFPKNPYFLELKGQALLESGKARRAVPVLKKAVALAPRAALIRILYAQAMLQTQNQSLLKPAIAQLRKALVTERRSAFAYRQLATAYARAGDTTRAELASAQEFMVRRNTKQAKRFAKRAIAKLKTGTRDWLIADDILRIKGR